MLSLTKALKKDRINEFIKQEQSRGVGPIRETEFEDTASILIKTPLSDDQTSGSPQSDGSRGK